MIDLIHVINKKFPETQIWGLTTIQRLVLLTENFWGSNWHVIITNLGNEEYYFEYSLPEAKAPWPDAKLKGVASSLNEATK